MARDRSTVRNAAEFALARSALFLTQILPEACVPSVSGMFGRILAAVLSGRRRVVRDNVRLAYGEDGPDPDQLARASFASLCRSFIELARVPKDPAKYRARIHVSDADLARLLDTKTDGPFVMAASHFGAYEVMGTGAGVFDFPLTTLVRPLDNPWLEAWLAGIRTRFGQRIAGNRGGLRELLRELHQGRNVAVLVDLNHRKSNRLFVEFFGVPAATAPTAALLARRSGRPLVPCFSARSSRPGYFHVELGEPVSPDPSLPREADLQRLMQNVTNQLEARVRAAPEQWLWTHRRWKTRPDG